MKKTTLRLVLIICASLVFLANCEDISDENIVSPEDSAAAVLLTSEANTALLLQIQELLVADPDTAQIILNSLDLSETNDLYAQAHALDYRNQDARFGLGFTSILMLSQNFGVDKFYGAGVSISPSETIRSNGQSSHAVGYGFGLPLSTNRVAGMVASFIEFPLASFRLKFEDLDSFNGLQPNIIENVIPMIETGLAALDSLDDDPAFSYSLGTVIQFDIIDITAMESSLFALQAVYKGLAAYNYELNTQDAAEMIAGLSLGSDYGTLRENGATLLSEAHAASLLSVEKVGEVLTLMESETPRRNHFSAQFDLNQSAQIRTGLEAHVSALSAANRFDFDCVDERGDIVASFENINLDISQHYLNPVLDLKLLLPPYAVTTRTAYVYNEVSVDETVNIEESEVMVQGLNNSQIIVNIEYSESTGDTSATVSIPSLFLSYNLLRADPSNIPVAIWDVWNEFLATIGTYSNELYRFPEISFYWSGFVTTGSSLTIDGNISIDYLERTSSYAAPEMIWTADTYEHWLAGWSYPTAQGLFPDFTAADLADFLGMDWE
ncbi:MAG: hypothetical protein K9M55_11145 [Candidatus Marinimicrobia bacterium]|nr:hypothetical protein [Candidatus Neomarinimicrobiota bacterium]